MLILTMLYLPSIFGNFNLSKHVEKGTKGKMKKKLSLYKQKCFFYGHN